MSCCSNKALENSSIEECPVCQKKGLKVGLITLKSLLKDESLVKIDKNKNYRFCKTGDCKVSYYSDDRTNFFKIGELKVPATAKDHGLHVHVCYCFDYTREKILNEIKETGETTALDDIKAKMKDPGCFCERSNPQGGCCLGNTTAWIKQAKKIISSN